MSKRKEIDEEAAVLLAAGQRSLTTVDVQRRVWGGSSAMQEDADARPYEKDSDTR